MSLPTIQSNKNLYGNILFLSPDGKEMFRGNLKKANWYLDRKIATIEQQDPLTIRLLFKPNGNGWDGDEYYLSQKNNSCVVCNSKNELTKHHVVPYEFRKRFPMNFKSHSSHDIVFLCVDCHEKYNKSYSKFRKKIIKKIMPQYPDHAESIANIRSMALSAAGTLFGYRDNIPEHRIKTLEDRIKAYTRKEEITQRMIYRLFNISRKISKRTKRIFDKKTDELFNIAINKYGPENISKIWRNHFIKTMNPKHLPIGWDVNKEFKKD